MNIAFISANKGLPWGGSEELWSAAARRALEAGHCVTLCIFDWPQPAHQVLALRDAGAALIPIPLQRPRFQLFGPRHPWLSTLAAAKPDIICISQGQEYDLTGRRWGPALVQWLKQSNTPAISVVQYNDDHHHTSPERVPLAREFINLVRLNAYVARRNIEQTQKQLGITIPSALVVRNPVNLTDISPLPWPPGPTLRLACVARLHAQTKGQDLLLAALADPQWRGRDWRLSLFGSGPDEAAFRETARTLNLTDRIDFRGFATDIRAVWAEHHALILPSRGEGTPLAMVEAMLLARPCILTNVGDCAAWTRDGLEGWIAAAPTANAVADALERAWQARDHWPSIGQSAATRARELFDPDAGSTLLKMLVGSASATGACAPRL